MVASPSVKARREVAFVKFTIPEIVVRDSQRVPPLILAVPFSRKGAPLMDSKVIP